MFVAGVNKMRRSPRQIAADVLNTLDKSHHHLDRVMEDVVSDERLSSKRDRNLVNALVYGVLRWRKFLDWNIIQHSSTPIEKIRPEILNILRLGIFQIFFLNRIPASAAVNTSVDMAKKIAPPWIAGYVNAVLRNAAKKDSALSHPGLDISNETGIAIIKSFPEWLIHRWLNRYGVEETLKLCDAHNEIPALTCRINTLKIERNEIRSAMADDVDEIFLTKYSPDGIFFYNPKTAIHHIKAFADGFFQVQDEAAQLISYLLSPHPGEMILDACAGLGGKTGHIAQLMKNEGRLIALDKDPQKISRLTVEMKRLGIHIVSTQVFDLKMPFSKTRFEKFDRILLDAPCSGLGVIRRNPDIKWDTTRQNLKRYHLNQLTLLSNVSDMAKIKGIIVYAVCSLEPEENEIVIFEFLKNHSNFAIIKDHRYMPFVTDTFLDQNGFLRSLPHVHRMDGFFAACLKRTG